MDERTFARFKTLTELAAPAGFEKPVRKYMEQEMAPYVERFERDRLGGTFGVIEGNASGPRVMVAGHMDEVGFMVTHIRPNGTLQLHALGGWSNQVLQAMAVRVVTSNGHIPGVISSIPPHLAKAEDKGGAPGLDQLFVDIGADDAAHARALGVDVGCAVVPERVLTRMADPKKLLAKAWDNRYGVGLAIELVEELHKQGGKAILRNTLFCGATVQEEVGLRGAGPAAALLKPDLFFGLDCSPASDVYGGSPTSGQLGQGVLLRLLDRTMVTHRGVVEFVKDTASTHRIPYQPFVSAGGTDAGNVHTSGIGVPSTVIGVCARYIHTAGSILHTDDYAAAKQLLVELVKAADQSTLDTILSYN
jgi:glutamyl aminopeptidase